MNIPVNKLTLYYEKFDEFKGLIENEQIMVKWKKTINDLDNTMQNTMIVQHEPHQISGVNVCAPEGLAFK
jgi:hypothetical protein